ncbi:MAG: serine hydrolase, partial [Bacteroidales bacterium]|nr:serine hydrolase [Bacteroidales bacterium]
MKKIFAILLLLCIALSAIAQINELPRSTPEEQGVPSKALIELFDSLHFMPGTDIHSMIVMRHGKVVGEFYPAPFAPEYQHTQYSSSKTLVSLAAGIAIDENLLHLTDKVVTFFPEYLPDSISANLAQMTLEDLLTMRSGIKPDWGMRSRGTEWIRTFLSKEVKNVPGEVFAYDSMVTYMISAIVQKVTGKTVLEYLKEKLFAPMNIRKVNWEISPEGVNTGGWGLHIQSESLAKVGQMWLDGGVWDGKQLVSKEWIAQMSSKHANGGDYGYGYQVWMCKYPGAVRADGALGQYVIVVP